MFCADPLPTIWKSPHCYSSRHTGSKGVVHCHSLVYGHVDGVIDYTSIVLLCIFKGVSTHRRAYNSHTGCIATEMLIIMIIISFGDLWLMAHNKLESYNGHPFVTTLSGD